MKNLLKLLDLSAKEIEDIINLADQYKYERSHGIARRILEGKTLGMLFQTPSTRTRVAFEAGIYHLGGHALYLPVDELQIGRGESTEDTARALSRYCDALMVRAFEQDELEYLAKYGTIPVINGLTEFAHPCQTLADLMTIREYKTRLDGLKVAFIGNGGAMMNSTIVGALKCRMNVAVACPENYDPAQEVLDYAAQVGHFEMYRDPRGAARAADVVITDSWIPMGREDEYARRVQAFRSFTVNEEVMHYAKPDAMILHCLPARKGEEITPELFEAHAGEIFEAAENRLHIHKAILTMLMEG